jgi:hypothetical protein
MGDGLVNVAQYARGDLSGQAGRILLATLMFEALTPGSGPLAFDFVQLNHGAYEYAPDLEFTTISSQLTVTGAPVPLPGALWLFGPALVGLGGVVGVRRHERRPR